MAEIIPTDENTINVELQVIPTTAATPGFSTEGLSGSRSITLEDPKVPSYEAYKVAQLKSETPTIPKIANTLDKVVLSLDAEITGLNPWDYKLIVMSVWNLKEHKSKMVTFSGLDEEKLCHEMFKYIEDQKPEVILAFNAKFESRCFISRAMLYHIKAPWIWTCEWHDMMAILEGGWKNGLTGTMPAGSEENWLKFFFNEVKPYTIDECFEGIREGSLERMIIRNRTCVQGQGDMYKLLMYCQAAEESKVSEEKPSTARISEMSEKGDVLVRCDVCEAVNEVKVNADPGQCWRCMAALPKPTASNIIKETVREIGWSKVGLSDAKSKTTTTAKKSTTTTKKA